MTCDAAVLGGAVSGLAAAEGLCDLDRIDRVTVFDRQRYDDRRVNCGEAINDASLIPLATTPANGFTNPVEEFELRVYPDTSRSSSDDRDHDSLASDDRDLLTAVRFPCHSGYICERDTVERRWAERLADRGVTFQTGESVTADQYASIVEEYDYVVDATGQPALTLKVRDRTDEYTGNMVALNAVVEGDFSTYVRRPQIFFEGYVGYAWSFPKSETRANVGIGWAGEDRPDDYVAALTAAAERNGFPVPDRQDVSIYTIPKGPSLDPRSTAIPEDGVFLVGDAAGIANRYQGEGICQGIRSAYLLCELIEEGIEEAYPERLYESLRSEYRLAHLLRGAWMVHEDPDLLAQVASAIEGLTIEEITRDPRSVIRRLIRQPGVTARLLANRGMLRRVYQAYTDTWEYGRTRPETQSRSAT